MKIALIALLFAAACTPARPIPTGSSLQRESRQECTDHCTTLDMRLASVVIIANNVGCVCEPKDAQPRASAGGGAAAAGAIIAAEAEQSAQASSAAVSQHHR